MTCKQFAGGMLCLLVTAFALQAQDKMSAEKEVAAFLESTVKTGAKMWNEDKNYPGTLKLYEEALGKVSKMLAGRPELVKIINDKTAKAAGQALVTDKAFALREAIDGVYLGLGTGGGAKALWDRLGGEPAVKAVVHEFVLKAAGDPKVNFFRDGKFKFTADDVKKLEQLLVELVSATTGGPLKYTGRSMKESHKGMGITEAEFGALAADLIDVLKSFKVPQKEIDELVGIIASTKGDIVEAKVEPKVMPKKDVTLWGRLGGEPAVRAVVQKFIVKAATDPKVNFFRDGKFKFSDADVKKLEQQLVELVSAVSGGPLKYTGRSMKESHKGMGITEAEFGAIAADLIDVLKEFKVPQKEIDELIGIIATTKGDIVEGKPEVKKDEPKLVEPKKEASKPKEAALWDRLGGEKAVRAVVHDFVITAATNPKVNFLRDGKIPIDEKGVEKLEQLLTELISAVSGGPLKYTGRSMKESHKGMGITEAEFGAIAADLIATLKKYKVPQKEIDELIAIVATTKDDIVEKK